MMPDQVLNPGPLSYESGALPIALRGPACKKTAFFAYKGEFFTHFFSAKVLAIIIQSIQGDFINPQQIVTLSSQHSHHQDKNLTRSSINAQFLRIISGHIFLFLNENLGCDPSLEMSQ